MSRINKQSLLRAFHKGPDKYLETYTADERAIQRKEITKFINTRKLIYDKLMAVKKKYNYTDKDLELRGLYPHKLFDPWINSLKEGKLTISGGGGPAEIPLDLGGIITRIAGAIRADHNRPDPTSPTHILNQYGGVVNDLAEAADDAQRSLDEIDQLVAHEAKYPEEIEIDFSGQPSNAPSGAESLALDRLRARMMAGTEQRVDTSLTRFTRKPNTAKANNIRDLIKKLVSSKVWLQDPDDPFRIFDSTTTTDQQNYIKDLFTSMDVDQRQRLLDIFNQYGVDLTPAKFNADNAAQDLENALRQNDILNDGRTPLQRRADLINDLRHVFTDQLNSLSADDKLYGKARSYRGVSSRPSITARELVQRITIRPRKIVERSPGEEIQAVPRGIVETKTLDNLAADMEAADINPININAFREILTNGFQTEVMEVYRSRGNWDEAVEQAWIASERRIAENIGEIERNNPALRYNFSNIRDLLMRIKDAAQKTAGNMADIPTHLQLLTQAAITGDGELLSGLLMGVAGWAQQIHTDVTSEQDVRTLTSMGAEMKNVAEMANVNLSEPSSSDYLDASNLLRRVMRDARDRGEAISIRLGGRRMGVGVSTERRDTRYDTFYNMDDDDFNQLLNEYAQDEDELADWNTMLHETPNVSKPLIIKILVQRAAGVGQDQFPPDEPPEEPDGMITVTSGRYRRRIKLSAWIAALIAAGVGVKKIADYVKKLKSKGDDKDKNGGGSIDKGGEKNNNTNIVNPTQPSDNQNRPMPAKPSGRPKPDPQFAEGTPTLSTVDTPEPDPVLGAYPIDTKGISKMGITPDVLDNINNYNELVRQYNQNLKDYETFLTTGTPTGLFGTGVANAADVNGQISKLMLDYKAKINNALQSLAQLPTGRESTALAAPQQSKYAFKQYANGPLMKYNEMRKTEATQRLGLDDDIDAYNDKARAYNKEMDRLAAKSPASGMRPEISGEVEYDINNAYKSLSAEMTPVARAERIGRYSAREITTYSDTEKAVIDKFINLRIELNRDGTPLQFPLTAEEEAAVADNPELFGTIQKYKDLMSRGRSLSHADITKLTGYKDYFAKIKANDYKPLSYVTPIANEYDERVLYEAKSKESLSVFKQSERSYRESQSRLASAIASGAPKHQISQLYQDMDTKRVDYNTRQAQYAESLTQVKDYGGVKSTYLGDMSAEVIPRTVDERRLFARLQNVEAAIQTNPDALKMYNDKTMTIHKNQNPLDIYRKRLDYLATISQQYGLAPEYATAMNQSLKAIETVDDEEPMAQIDAPTDDGINDNDQQYRAEMVDPAEAKLFLSSKQEAEAEQRRWQEYSTVAPNNGLGSVRTNPLLRAEVDQYITRFANTDRGLRPTRTDIELMNPMRVAQREGLSRRRPAPRFTPEIQCAFGQDHFENEFVIPSMIGGEMMTRADDDLPDNRYGTWVKPSIYHPEYQMMVYNTDLASSRVMEGPYARDAKYRFLPQNVRPQYYPIDTREYLGKTMSDNFGSRLNFNDTLDVANLNKVGAMAKPTLSIYDNSTIKKLGVKYR